jgi:nucleoid-associated protein YgaU
MVRFARVLSILGCVLVLANCPTTPKKTDTVAAPAFNPAEGTYPGAQSVVISSSTEGAAIRYTLDGSSPTPTSGTEYKAPVSVTASVTIKAVAFKNGMQDSPVASAAYVIAGAVAAVQFSPAAGTYDKPVSIALSSATAGAEIWYTTDGSTPAAGKATKYGAPIPLASSTTITALAAKKGWADSAIASAAYTIGVVAPVSEAEIMEARNAIARAREVDADYYDPDNYAEAQRLLDEALALRAAEPAGARVRLAETIDAANLAFDNAVARGAADLARRMEAARQRLLTLEADKFMASEFDSATAGIGEAEGLYAAGSYAEARARALAALRDMSDLANSLQDRLDWVRQLKRETEQLMKQAEDTGAYADAPGQKEKVTGLYTQGIGAWQAYELDPAEEYFGAAREAARDTLRISREKRDTRQAEEKKKAEAMMKDVMKALEAASKLTVVTEDGTVIEPQNWTEEDFLKEIERMEQEEQKLAPGAHSMIIPSGGVAVMAEESTENLLRQARELWTLGLREKAQGNYEKAQDYFAEALRYIEIYKSYAVKGVYTVRLILERRDCLWRIAEYPDIYGDPYLWPKIWRRNRKLIQNPDLIYPGWQLVIPPQ